jgi:hypothetical protein
VFRRLPDARLLVVDPLPAYLGRGVNDARNAELRSVLEPLGALLDEFGVCLLSVTHLGKSPDLRTPTHRILGSVAYGNLARTVHVTVRDPDDKQRRYLAMVKSNLGPTQPTLEYHIAEHFLEHGEDRIRTSRAEFQDGPCDVDAAEMMNRSRSGAKRGPEPAKAAAVAEWLFDFLSSQPGPTPLAAVFDAAGLAGMIGSQKQDGRWSCVSALYRAAKTLPGLPAPRDGKRVHDFGAPIGRGGKEIKHWQLVDVDAAF